VADTDRRQTRERGRESLFITGFNLTLIALGALALFIRVNLRAAAMLGCSPLDFIPNDPLAFTVYGLAPLAALGGGLHALLVGRKPGPRRLLVPLLLATPVVALGVYGYLLRFTPEIDLYAGMRWSAGVLGAGALLLLFSWFTVRPAAPPESATDATADDSFVDGR